MERPACYPISAMKGKSCAAAFFFVTVWMGTLTRHGESLVLGFPKAAIFNEEGLGNLFLLERFASDSKSDGSSTNEIKSTTSLSRSSTARSGVRSSHHRRQFLWTSSSTWMVVMLSAIVGRPAPSKAQALQDANNSSRQTLQFQTEPVTGVMMADIFRPPTADAGRVVVEPTSKVNIHIVGRLLGKNGWIFENSREDKGGEPYRLQLGSGAVIPGLEVGLQGMVEGGIRRVVVPSSQGYLDKALEPIPRDFGNRQRLYTTVMNSVRIDRERELLGLDLAGKVVFDVELLRIR